MIREMLHLAAEDGDGDEITVPLACDFVAADLGAVSREGIGKRKDRGGCVPF